MIKKNWKRERKRKRIINKEMKMKNNNFIFISSTNLFFIETEGY
jgi:hypothetical protein